MKIDAIIEQEQIRTIVIYPGRFQPPHIGHAKTYQALAKKYGAENTFIATSNKTDSDKSPFGFQEKKALLTAAGVPADKIVQVVSTYAAKEITDQFDLSKTRVFYAVGAKDMEGDPRFSVFTKKDGSPAYLQKLEGAKKVETADKHAYIVVAPTVEFTVNGKPFTSASEFRQAFKNANPAEQAELAQQLYGAGAQKVLPILQKKLFKTEEEAIREAIEEAWSKKYKKSIDCNNPKGFSQRAHCAGRRARRAGKKTTSGSVSESQLLDKPTPTVKELADKYRKTIPQMNHILGKGIKVEMEHTNDVEIAREIALDHLSERVDYYELLNKVERAPKKLDELANAPYPYMLWKRTMMGNSYLFQTDAGQDMVVSIVPETLADGTNRVEVMFADKATFGLEKTGKGDAFRIFATVAQILKDYIAQAKFNIGEIYFTGKTKEPSRIKLYDKIARRLGQHIPGFEFHGAGDNNVEKGYFFKKTGEKVEEEVIDEVSMSPGALADFAKTDIAKSMTVGFEAEMAIEDMEQDEPNYDDSEPDWDANEPVPMNGDWRRTIISFFTRPDAAMNTRNEVEGVLEQIDEEYFEWISEQYQEWLDSDESAETITKFLKDYDEDISDEDIEDTIKFKKNNYWGSIEDDVREDWEADNMNDDSFREFMEYRDYDTMQGIYDKYSGELYWPYFTEPDYGGGSVSYEEIEMSFVETTGYKATVSSGYHSATRKPGVWIFEPDSSIEPAGVELVSPPMPLDEGLKALDDFFAWAKGYGAEANESTGFHMGVSIPEQTMDNVDHLKLILFLGDEYVLKQFGRESNTYTKSSLDRIRGQLRSPRANIPELLAQFKQGLNSEAAKMAGSLMVPKGDRYVSVNIKSNYIEFRSAGGNYFEKIPEIKNTMLRYVRAMAIAADPEAEKNEYAKKLYKLISTAFPEDLNTIKYFSGYAAGTITRSELKAMVTYARSERQRKATPATPPKTYEIYLIGTNYVYHTFTARDDMEASDYAVAWARQNNKTDWDVRLSEPKPLPGSTPGVVPGSTADRAQQRAAAADPSLTTYSAKYRDQDGVEKSIGITASTYAQAQEQYMNLRRAYPHISFIGLQTNPQEGRQTNESRAKLFDSLMDEQQIKEITQNPSVWNRFLKSDKANLVAMGFEAEMVVKGVTDETQPVVTRKNNPVFPDIRTREGKKAFVDFWTQNDAQSKREAEISYKAILDRFEQDDWKEWIEGRPTWKTFLDEHGVERMADLVYHEDEDFRMVWPFGMQKGGFTKSDLQKDFEATTGYKSVMSNEYHGDNKPKNAFVFEPDSSIKAKSRNDLGQELVSPPMPLPKAMEALNKVYDWIAKSGRVYTNNSTGFHINVSMKKTKLSNIDQMKLLLLVGDQHILREFKRLSNEYCESLLGKLKEAINDLKGDSEYNEPQAEELDDLIAAMKNESWKGLRDIANDMMEEAGIDDKYVSMHSHGDYLEFRSPGGDWVNARENIINTVLRITHAYTVAADPEEGRNDYLKKAYSLIAGGVKDDELKSFIDYSMGAISAKDFKAKLTKKWASINKSRGPLKAFEIEYQLGGFSAKAQVAVIHATDKKSAVDRLNKILDSTRRMFFVGRGAKEVAMQPETLSLTKGKSKTLIPTPTSKNFVITYQNPRTGKQDTSTVSAYTDQDARDIWTRQYNPTNIYKIISVQPAVNESQLNELFDNPYPIEDWDEEPDMVQADFTTEDGNRIMITYKKITQTAWEILFTIGYKDARGNFKVAFTKTGTGDAPRIFATVLSATATFVQKYKPAYLYFGGKSDEPSRVALYKTMIRQLSGKMGFAPITAEQAPPDLQAHMDKYKDHTAFILKNKSAPTPPNPTETLDEMLKQVKGKWALVSRQDPEKVLQYYRGHGKPSEDWVNKVERRVQAFKHMEEAVEPKPFVFVDMDGVLADFFGEWAKLDGKDHYKDIEHKESALDLVRKHPNFWTKLPLLPHAKELLRFIKKHYGEYYILSKPLEGDPHSEPGKRAWIQEHLQDVAPARMIFTADKQRFAYVGGQPNILIDDFGKNIDLWKMNGGIGIKYRPYKFEQTIKILKGLSR